MIAAVPLASVWTINRDDRFWIGLIIVAAFGAVSALKWTSGRLLPGAVWFGVLYPVGIALGISIENVESDGRLGAGALLGWMIVLLLAALPVVGRVRNSVLWFRWWAVGWSLCSLALLLVYGIGVFFVPLAVASGLAARWYRSNSTVFK